MKSYDRTRGAGGVPAGQAQTGAPWRVSDISKPSDRPSPARLGQGLILALLLTAGAFPGLAASISLTNSDASGATSFGAKGKWNDSVAPNGANDYFTGAFTLRTTTATGSSPRTFAGGSLSVDTGGALTFKTSDTIVVNNLKLNGGTLSQAGSQPTAALQGTIISVDAVTTLDAQQSGRALDIQSGMSGASGLIIDSTVNSGGVIQFSAANTYAGTTTINSKGALKLAGGANTIKTGNNIVVNGTLNMNNNAQTFDSVTGSGSITTGGGALTVGVNNSSPTFSGIISDGGSVTKGGTGTLTLSGANTFSSGLTVLAGTVMGATSASCFGGSGTGPINLGDTSGNASATLFFSTSGGIVIANPITARSGSTGNTLTLGNANGGAFQTFSGAITLDHDATLEGTASAATTFSGSISGGSGVIANGRSVRFANLNTYSGLTTINNGATLLFQAGPNTIKAGNDILVNGTLNLNNYAQTFNSVTGNGTIRTGGGALTIGSGDSSSMFSGVISETGSLIKVGAGTLTLSGANSYTGDTTISAGTLTLADNAQMKFVIGANGVNNKILGTGTLNLAGDLNFDLGSADLTSGNSWNIVDVANLATTFGTTFSVLNGFAESSDVWTWQNGDNTWTFTESTGVLGVAAVPEPSVAALLVPGLGLLAGRRAWGLRGLGQRQRGARSRQEELVVE